MKFLLKITALVLAICLTFPLQALAYTGGIYTGPLGEPGANMVKVLSGGYRHSLALRSDGTVWAWGNNGNGQLGDGTTTNRSTPVQVKGPGGQGYLTDVVAVTTGAYHSLALRSNGTVWAWGWNNYGQLGDGTTADRYTPVQVKGPNGQGYLTDVVAVAAGAYHSLALRSDGTVWAWGYNSFGRLGDGTTADRYTPVQVKGPNGQGYLTDVVAVSAGGAHSLALRSDGTVWAWGDNGNGQLGDGTTVSRSTPVQVVGPGGQDYLTDVVAVAAGNFYSLALRSDGTVWAWGDNGNGQLGDGTTEKRSTSVQVLGPGGQGYLTDVVAVAAGYYHSFALRSDGTVWAWGWNFYGQLGDGTAESRSTPVQVVDPGGQGYLTDVVAVSAGFSYSLALRSDGTVWAWGDNGNGQLGDGTTTNRYTPVQVQNLTGVMLPSSFGPTIQNLTVRPDSVALLVGETRQLQVTAVYSDGTTEDVTGSATYASGNSSIAAVSGSGLITGEGPGAATITITYGGHTATVSVIVSIPVVIVQDLTVQPNPVNLTVGSSQPLTVTAVKSDGSTQDVTDLASYEVSNMSVAAIEGATVTGLAPGTGTLVVTYGEVTVSVPVTVSEPQGSGDGSGSGGGGSGATVVSPPPRPGAPSIGPRPASSPAVNYQAGRTVQDVSAIPVAALPERSQQAGSVVSPPARSSGGAYGISPVERSVGGSIPVVFQQR